MKIKKTIKKIIALGTGVAMVGSTILGATATMDLNAYPKPFVEDGNFNAVMVVGDTAAPVDIIGAIDVAASLQYNMKVETPINIDGSETVSISGGKKIETSGNKLRYGDVMSDVLATVLPEDLPTVLVKEGTVTGEDGDEYTYKTSIKTPNSEIKFGEPGDEESPVVYLDFNSGIKYKQVIEFPKSVDMKDLVDANIVLFGKEYTVSGKDSELDSETLTLYGGAVDQTFQAGDTTTVNDDIDITVLGVNTQSDEPTATITINGETKTVEAGKSYTIGGEDIYVKDIFAYTAPVTSGAVRLYIGSDKLVLEDGNNVELKENDIEGTNVMFTSSGDKVSKIEIEVVPSEFDEEVEYIGEDGELVDPVFKTFKFVMAGANPSLDSDSREEIKITPESRKLNVEWISKGGIEYDMDMFYEENGIMKLGNSASTSIITNNDETIEEDDYFIVSKDGYSHILELTKVDDDPTEITVKDDGDTYTFSYSGTTGTMTFDGYSYGFVVSGETIKLTNGATNTVITEEGASLQFTIDAVNSCNTYPANAAIESSITCNNYTAAVAQTPIYTPGTDYIDSSTISCPSVPIVYTPTYVPLTNTSRTLVANISCVSPGYANSTNFTYDIVYKTDGTPVPEKAVISSIVCIDGADTSVPTYSEYTVGTNITSTCTTTLSGAKVIIDEASEYNDETTTNENNYANQYVVDISYDDDVQVSIDVDNAYDIGDSDKYKALTPYGTVVEYGDSDEDITLYYNGEANTYDVFIAPTDAVTTVSSGSEYTTESTEKISVGMAKLASEITDITAQNLITVGGPCVNTVSAALMGNPENCAEGFVEGVATIKLFEQANGNVAMMIAGYSADDTKRATRVVSDYEQYTGFEGTEIEVMGTTMNDIQISVPVATTTTTMPEVTTTEVTTTTIVE